MENRRMMFIYTQTGSMLALIVLLALLSALTLPLFGALSYFALLTNLRYYNLKTNMGDFGRRVDALIVGLGVISVLVMGYEIAQIAGLPS
jgi:hypothetical protein